MNTRASCVWLSLSLLPLASVAAGGFRPEATPPPEVAFVLPVAREVTDHEGFLGRTEPSSAARLEARVSGYLECVLFEDGEAETQLTHEITVSSCQGEEGKIEFQWVRAASLLTWRQSEM